jgi:hypothetical protein
MIGAQGLKCGAEGPTCLALVPTMIIRKICYAECFQGHINRHQTNGQDHVSAVAQNIVGHVEVALAHSFYSFSHVTITMQIPRSLTCCIVDALTYIH